MVVAADTIEGVTKYEFKPGQDVMQFEAVQLVKTHKTHKTRAKDEVEWEIEAGVPTF